MAEQTPFYMDINNVYSGDELGLPHRDVFGEGIVGTADLLVTAGSGNTVNVAKGAGWVTGDTDVDHQPTYRVFNDAVVNLGITPDPSNPRKVLIIGQINDATFSGATRNWQLQAIHGTPAGSPADPAMPASAVLLSTILVPAAAGSSAAYTFTDSRVRAQIGQGQALSSGGGGAVAIDFRNPQQAANAGNVFPNVIALTAHESWHWEFLKDVDGKLFGLVRVPSGVTAAKIVLATRYNATTLISRWSVAWASFADAVSSNPGALTGITAQDITVPGTARVRKDVTFVLGSQPVAGDLLIVQIFHEGAHANDTVAVNSELLGAWLLPS